MPLELETESPRSSEGVGDDLYFSATLEASLAEAGVAVTGESLVGDNDLARSISRYCELQFKV